MTDDTSVRVELHVRSLAPCEAQPGLERLVERLDTVDRIDDCGITVWGERLGLTEAVAATDEGARLRGRVREFRDWAHANGVDLVGGFERVTRTSTITGRVQEFLTLPPVVVAVRRDGDLVDVRPHSDGETIHTVRDWFDDREGRTVEPSVDRTAPAPADD